jgi:hypothetical protein
MGCVGVGVTEEGVKGFPLLLYIFIRGETDSFVYCFKDFLEAGASAQVNRGLFVVGVAEAA